MRITSLEINGFGVWSGLKLSRVPDGLGVVYGPNEAGKTTIMEFTRSMLFGFGETRSRYLPPLSGVEAGGSLTVSHAGRSFRIARSLGDEGETVAVTDPDGMRQGEHLLKSLLHDVEPSLYNGVFCIGLAELQKLALLDGTQAAAMLYNLSIGGPSISMVDVIGALRSSRDHILDASGGDDRLSRLLRARREVLQRMADMPQQMRVYEKLIGRQRQLQEDVAELRDRIKREERDARVFQLAENVRDAWERREVLDGEIDAIGHVEPVSEHMIREIDRLREEMKQAEAKLEAVRGDWDALQDALADVEVDQKLLEFGPTIRGLMARGDWHAETRRRADELARELRDGEAKLANRTTYGDESAALPVHRLREIARHLLDEQQRLTDARQNVEICQRSLDNLEERLQSGLARHEEDDLVDAKERANERQRQLKDRIQFGHDLDALLDRREVLEQRCKELRDNPDLSPGSLLVLGVLAVAGLVLVLGAIVPQGVLALLGIKETWGSGFATLGGLMLVASGGLTYYGQWKIRTNRETSEQQLKLNREQLEHKQNQIDSLDAVLPIREESLEEQLRMVEDHWQSLKEMDYDYHERESARKEVEAAHEEVRRLEVEMARVENRWKSTLREGGLPERLSPRELEEIIAERNEREEVEREVERTRQELAFRRRELEITDSEVRRALVENRVDVDDADPMALLAELNDRLREQEENRSQRIELSTEKRKLRKDWRKAKQDVLALRKKRKRVLMKADVRDERELRERREQFEKQQQLQRDRDAAQREISTALGGVCTEDDIAEQLAPEHAAQLADRLLEAEERLETMRGRLDELHQEKGRCDERVKSLRSARDEGAAMLELSMIEARLKEAVHQWRVRAVACRMLEDIRNGYETERQPETLATASEYLARLTHGRYRRVWTPMGDNSLRVDTSEGETLRPDVLSHGTREQLFLALRFALADAFAGRGIRLPMILDDVLVNFDTRRAEAAAKLIRDFAATGHQVLLFTCHRHIAELFHELDAPVRRLMRRREGGGDLDFRDDEPRDEPAPPRPPVDETPVVEETPAPEPPMPEPPQDETPEVEDIVVGETVETVEEVEPEADEEDDDFEEYEDDEDAYEEYDEEADDEYADEGFEEDSEEEDGDDEPFEEEEDDADDLFVEDEYYEEEEELVDPDEFVEEEEDDADDADHDEPAPKSASRDLDMTWGYDEDWDDRYEDQYLSRSAPTPEKTRHSEKASAKPRSEDLDDEDDEAWDNFRVIDEWDDEDDQPRRVGG